MIQYFKCDECQQFFELDTERYYFHVQLLNMKNRYGENLETSNYTLNKCKNCGEASLKLLQQKGKVK